MFDVNRSAWRDMRCREDQEAFVSRTSREIAEMLIDSHCSMQLIDAILARVKENIEKNCVLVYHPNTLAGIRSRDPDRLQEYLDHLVDDNCLPRKE